MERTERERMHNGGRTNGARDAALGDVARDAIDHVTMIARDTLKIGKLEARRYVEHVRRDVAPRAAYYATAAVIGLLGVTMALIAVFLGFVRLIGVAWSFALYSVVFLVGAGVVYAIGRRPADRDEGAEIARRFPAARAVEGRPHHALIEQRSSAEAHRIQVREAEREERR